MKFIFILFFGLTAYPLNAQDGILDNSFGSNGISMHTAVSISSRPGYRTRKLSSAIQPDGKIIRVSSTGSFGASQNLVVARFTHNGQPDNTFNGTGQVILSDLGGTASAEYAVAVQVQADGRIVVGGGTALKFLLLRLNPDGSLDNSFNGNGIVITDLSTNTEEILTMALQADGKIVVAGLNADLYGTFQGTYVVRYNADGSLDNCFGTNGLAYINIPWFGSEHIPFITEMLIQTNGKILLSGMAQTGGSSADIVLARLNSDGSMDLGFGTNGRVFKDFLGRANFGDAIAIQPDGKILVGGAVSDDDYENSDFFVARFNIDGSIDNSFGLNGYMTLDVGTSNDNVADIAVQQDGKICITGNVPHGHSQGRFVMVRLTVIGSIDYTFANNGIFSLQFTNSDHADAALIQGNNIILTGTSVVTGQGRFFSQLRLINSSPFYYPTLSIPAGFVFSGNGNWYDPANWTNGQMPAQGNLTPCQSVNIIGNAVVPPGSPAFSSSGNISIANGASLVLQRNSQISGPITVMGIFDNHGTLDHTGGDFTIFGTLNNYATITSNAPIIVKSGGQLNNLNSGTISASNITVNAIGGLINSGEMIGNATINGPIINSGTISPGNSSGNYNINGAYSATASANHNFELASVSSYDQIISTGTVKLDGKLNLSVLNGFVPSGSVDFTIITGDINGSFSAVNLPPSYAIIYNANSVVIRYLSVLPVNFLNLSLQTQAPGVNIQWKVSGEQNVSHYEIEKRTDGQTFSKVGEVTAIGQMSYNYMDNTPGGKSFYRIKSIDHDGRYRYSIVLSYISGRMDVELKIFPVPADYEITLQHPASVSGLITINNMMGAALISIVPHKLSQQSTIDISSLTPGVYVIEFKTKTHQIRRIKFVRQRG